jgi:hypothetical protein
MHGKEVTISVAEVTFTKGKKKSVRINVDGQNVDIPVDEQIYAYFNEQFLRPNPTELQRKRFATIMNVLRAAYFKGVSDGSKN